MAEENSAGLSLNIRSVNYPYIPLQEAVMLAHKLWDDVQKAGVDIGTVGKAWNFSEKSSGLRSSIAALRQYGLLDSTGWGETRKLKLSHRGLDIVTEQEGSPKWLRAVAEAALAPKIYSEIFANFPDGLPPTDHAIGSYLLREKDFNKNAVPTFITNLRANLRFAQLNNPVIMPPAKAEPEPKKVAEVGDLVQWESSGVLKLPQPMRVRAVQEHEGAQWVFVEGSETGIPMAEVLLQEKGEAKPQIQAAPPTLPLETAALKQALGPNEKEWLRGQLSRDTNYRLMVSGEIGPKEIGKLMKILKAQQEVLSDDEEDKD